jgi:membrane glycosyltransferase
VAPFIDHCALPTLRASPGGGGSRFMSHDYVEAALMRRANYEVWMAYDLGGS